MGLKFSHRWLDRDILEISKPQPNGPKHKPNLSSKGVHVRHHWLHPSGVLEAGNREAFDPKGMSWS